MDSEASRPHPSHAETQWFRKRYRGADSTRFLSMNHDVLQKPYPVV